MRSFTKIIASSVGMNASSRRIGVVANGAASQNAANNATATVRIKRRCRTVAGRFSKMTG